MPEATVVARPCYNFRVRAIVRSRGLLLFALLAGALAPGCIVRQTHDPLLAAELRNAREANAKERERVAALEARLAEVERTQSARVQPDRTGAEHGNTTDRALLEKLDELLALNQRLLEEAEAARKRDAATTTTESNEPAALDAPTAKNREEALRQIVYEMHGQPGRWRGGLSLEQSEALRILLKRERTLDDSPWD